MDITTYTPYDYQKLDVPNESFCNDLCQLIKKCICCHKKSTYFYKDPNRYIKKYHYTKFNNGINTRYYVSDI